MSQDNGNIQEPTAVPVFTPPHWLGQSVGTEAPSIDPRLQLVVGEWGNWK
jgi:hypothetical protein